MSFISTSELQAFAGAEDWIIDKASNLSEAITQADNIIYQMTGISPPASPSLAVPILRNIACALVVWFTTGQQGDLTEFEYRRREKLYNDAIDKLIEIKEGKLVLKDADGKPIGVQTKTKTMLESTQRITEAL